jgi:hypothetical protein
MLNSQFYTVDDVTYTSKFAVMKALQGTNKTAEFHVYSDALDGLNLLAEPLQSLEELYAKRARELRAKYDHIVLFFTGGTDSEHVFRTFYNNGLKVDELVNWSYERNLREKNYDLGLDIEALEADKLSIPLMKYIKAELCPDIKITSIDYTKIVTDFWTNMGKNWHETLDDSVIAALLTPGCAWRADMDAINPEWARMTAAGKKICFLACKEKVRVKRDTKGYYLQYHDNQNHRHKIGRINRKDDPINIEMFYGDDTTLELQLKLAHVLTRSWLSNPVYHNYFERPVDRAWENAYANAVYGKRLLPLPYLGGKQRDQAFGKRYASTDAASVWFFEDKNSSWMRNWYAPMQEIASNLSKTFRDADDLMMRGFHLIDSKRYYFQLNSVHG